MSVWEEYSKWKVISLQWETLSPVIANTINDLPIRLGNIISDYENMDLITPNWLWLGWNNDQNPAAMEVTGNPDRFLKEKIFQSKVRSLVVISSTTTDESS